MPQWRSGRVQVPRHSVALRSSTLGMLSLDLSMHAAFKGELRVALGDDGGGYLTPLLPQVFADGRHLGGAEEVCRLHEARELVSALDACDAAPCTTKESWAVLPAIASKAMEYYQCRTLAIQDSVGRVGLRLS